MMKQEESNHKLQYCLSSRLNDIQTCLVVGLYPGGFGKKKKITFVTFMTNVALCPNDGAFIAVQYRFGHKREPFSNMTTV